MAREETAGMAGIGSGNPDSRSARAWQDSEQTTSNRQERMKDMNENRECGVLTDAEVEKVRRHYRHAVEKHPRFADRVSAVCSHFVAADVLRLSHERLRDAAAVGSVSAVHVLDCEVAEVMEAETRGDKANAVEECYDAIAVLLRMVDVLEGRQALGSPDKEKKEEAE